VPAKPNAPHAPSLAHLTPVHQRTGPMCRDDVTGMEIGWRSRSGNTFRPEPLFGGHRLIAYLVRAVAFDINGATAAPPGTDIRRRRPFEASVAKTCRSRTLDRHRRSLPQTTEGKAAAGDQPSLLRAGQLAEGIMP
jgi:hypothetical protein